jgi:hypothetical protein
MPFDERYRTLMGSDLERDGMFLELWDHSTDTLALWAFYSDADGSMEFERYRDDVPADVESWFKDEARRRLPPVQD